MFKSYQISALYIQTDSVQMSINEKLYFKMKSFLVYFKVQCQVFFFKFEGYLLLCHHDRTGNYNVHRHNKASDLVTGVERKTNITVMKFVLTRNTGVINFMDGLNLPPILWVYSGIRGPR